MQKLNFFSCAEPFYRSMQIFGLFPLPLEVRRGKRQRLKKFCAALTTAAAVIIFISCLLFNFEHMELFGSNSVIMDNVWDFGWIIGLFSILIMTVCQWSKCKSILECVNAVNEVDSKVNLRLK